MNYKIRTFSKKDIRQMVKLAKGAYPIVDDYDRWGIEHFENILNIFPRGLIIAIENEGKIIGLCGAMILPYERMFTDLNNEITEDDGNLGTHTPEGDVLYLYELIVQKEYRKKGIGSDLVEFQKKLAREMNLKGCCVVSLVPSYKDYSQIYSINEYIKAVNEEEKRLDPNLRLYESLGFKQEGIRDNYFIEAVGGYGIIMKWHNEAG